MITSTDTSSITPTDTSSITSTDISSITITDISSIIIIDTSSLEEPNTTDHFINNQTFSSKKSSSKMSIGVIIGIIGGVVAIIVAVTIIICRCKKKNKISLHYQNESSINITNVNPVTYINPDLIYEYEPEKKSVNKKKIIFETTSQYKVQISIEPEKTIEDLIKTYINENNDVNIIVVNDVEDKFN